MSDIADRFAGILYDHQIMMAWEIGLALGCECGHHVNQDGYDGEQHNAHVSALLAEAAEQHYRPRIATPDQLNALPVQTVLLSEDDPADLHVIGDFGPVNLACDSSSPGRFVPPELPVIAVWTPGGGR